MVDNHPIAPKKSLVMVDANSVFSVIFGNSRSYRFWRLLVLTGVLAALVLAKRPAIFLKTLQLRRKRKEHDMAERQDGSQSADAAEGLRAGSDRGFVSAPSADELKPTETEVFLLDTLWKWQETSEKSRIVLGQPLNS